MHVDNVGQNREVRLWGVDGLVESNTRRVRDALIQMKEPGLFDWVIGCIRIVQKKPNHFLINEKFYSHPTTSFAWTRGDCCSSIQGDYESGKQGDRCEIVHFIYFFFFH